MNKDDASLLRELKKLTGGLMFQSESDYPVEPFVQTAKGQKPLSAQDIVAAKKTDASASVSDSDFDAFFSNATQEQDWQSPEAREQVKRFQALVKSLKDNLSELKVYKVGETEADVYVIGKTASGNFAGVKTKVVET
ncbi:MAG: nuclease A inhibitor family protein [Acidobacteria bacterium]|nr:nuclease A inhibitor family protein [Acidobacteriota bacterium]